MIDTRNRLKNEIEICLLHEERLKTSLKHVMPMLPIKPQFIKDAKDEELAFLDMLATRFAKLQDTLGKKVFPLMLRLMEEYNDEDSFIDQLNRLERLEIIDSTEHWRELRNIRNNLAHEYETDPEKLCEVLNNFVKKCHDLIEIWQRVNKYIKDKKLV